MEEFNIIPNGKRNFFKTVSPPRETGIPLKHDYILTHQTGSRITRGGGGGKRCHTRLSVFGEGGGGEGDKISKCYTFDLFTLSINIH